jgi:hypothetical protein
MGGAVAIEAFASERPPAADRLVLLAPAVWGWSTQSLPNRTLLWLAAHTIRGKVLEPPAFVTRKIRASDNIEELIRMGRDPQLIWGARPDAIYGLVNLMEAASRDIGPHALCKRRPRPDHHAKADPPRRLPPAGPGALGLLPAWLAPAACRPCARDRLRGRRELHPQPPSAPAVGRRSDPAHSASRGGQDRRGSNLGQFTCRPEVLD